jgi:hypothetical protein
MGISVPSLLAPEAAVGLEQLRANSDVFLAMGMRSRHVEYRSSFEMHLVNGVMCKTLVRVVSCHAICADTTDFISDCDLSPATRTASLLWMKAIDERSSSSSSSSGGGSSSPCCAMIIARSYSDGPFSRHRRLKDLKPRLDVSTSHLPSLLFSSICKVPLFAQILFSCTASHTCCSLQSCVKFNPATGGHEVVNGHFVLTIPIRTR